jgi:hypothetical protein
VSPKSHRLAKFVSDLGLEATWSGESDSMVE